jgi:phage head maturation protease
MPLLSERRIARMERAATTGRVIPYLAAVTVMVMFGSAFFVEVFSPNSFDSFDAPGGPPRQ